MDFNFTLALDELVNALTAKGYHDPEACIRFRESNAWASITLEFDYRVDPEGLRTYERVRPGDVEFSSDPAVFFAEAQKRIAAMPTVREALIKAFVNSLEELKSKAEDLELDVDFVNPLTAIMAKLATNAITHQK